MSEPVPLKAGPLSMILDAGDLRYLKFGGREVVRRIHGTVRDRNWNTVPGVISDLRCEESGAAFHIRYASTHRRGDVHFVWNVRIAGDEQGTVRFELDGEAKTTFLRNRIGICVLHPILECAGAKCRVRYTDGRESEKSFPWLVAREQPIAGLHDLAGISHEIEPGVRAEIRFEGEVFETEDQRNWIDGSFKTFCTPLKLPFPVEVRAGTRVRQCVTLRLIFEGVRPVTAEPVENPADTVAIRIVEDAEERLPDVGLGMASHGGPLSEREVSRLVRLGLTHLRVDLRLSDADWPARLRSAARDAFELGVALELAIHLPTQGEGDFAAVAKALSRMKVDLTRALIFRDGRKSTPADDLDAARVFLEDFGMAVGAGTDGDLYYFNQQPPPPDADFICWSMNPQVHSTDILSIAETPGAAAQQVAGMHVYHPEASIVVSPVTFKPRFNPVATAAESNAVADELPPPVDSRQTSLFAAGWTLGMFKALAETRTDSVTFYETTGWRGVMETEKGSPLPEKFRSKPGEVFPLFHVLADVGEFAGGRVIATTSDEPLAVVSLLLAKNDLSALLLANLTAKPCRVDFSALPQFRRIRQMDAGNMETAKQQPELFRREIRETDGVDLELPPFAVVRLFGGAIASGGVLP